MKRIVCGSVMSVVSVLALIGIVTNHVNAPPREGLSDGRYIAGEVEANVLAYLIAASVLGVGLWSHPTFLEASRKQMPYR